MVLLTAVPVSVPASMVTGVMVATGAPPELGAIAIGAAAVGGAPASPAVGASEAVMSPLSPPNRLSTSEQAARPRPAVSAKARNRPLLSPCVAGIPLIMLSAARRRCPPPKPADKEIWRQNPTPAAPARTRGPLRQVLPSRAGGDKGAHCRFGGNRQVSTGTCTESGLCRGNA